MRPKTSRDLLLLALCVGCSALFLLTSCSDEKDNQLKEEPLLLRETIPADSLMFPKGELFETVSMRFNRPAKLSEVSIYIYPEPSQNSELMRSSTGHTLFFENLKFSTLTDRHFLWIDGPTMPAPQMRVWFDGSGNAAIVVGSLLTSNPNPARNSSGVVYLLPLDTDYQPLDPGSFADARPLAITRPVWNGTTSRFNYSFNDLPDNTAFYVVAIFDTNDDGFYDPGADLWGCYGAQPGSLFKETVVSAIAGPMDPPPTQYEFLLLPPLTP